jgi:hypothetical protein
MSCREFNASEESGIAVSRGRPDSLAPQDEAPEPLCPIVPYEPFTTWQVLRFSADAHFTAAVAARPPPITTISQSMIFIAVLTSDIDSIVKPNSKTMPQPSKIAKK